MDQLMVRLQSVDEKAMFSTTARENPEIIIDYFPPVGTGQGYTSLELLMASFGSCISTTLLTLLRYRMKKSVEGISADIGGIVREEHPKSLACMKVDLQIRANNLTETEVQQALSVAEKSLCPVWAMIKGNVEIDITVNIVS